MHLDSPAWVSVAGLVVFISSAIASFIICSRHGFTRSSGWIYTLIICLVRTIGAICQLLTYHDESTGLLQATVVIDSIGLLPLLLAALGMISRLVDQINNSSRRFFTVKHFRLLQLLITLGLILSIAGGSSESTGADVTMTISTTVRVSIILYIVAYVDLVLVCIISLGGLSVVTWRERRTAFGVVIALPFVFVRLSYSTLAVFVHNHYFNIITGSVRILLLMAVVEEFIVVILYLILGFYLDKSDSNQQGPIASRPWKKEKSQRQSYRSIRQGYLAPENFHTPQDYSVLRSYPASSQFPAPQGYTALECQCDS